MEALKIKYLKMKLMKMYLNLEVTEVVIVHCNNVNNNYQQD